MGGKKQRETHLDQPRSSIPPTPQIPGDREAVHLISVLELLLSLTEITSLL